MSISQKLGGLLICPETKQKLSSADPLLINHLNLLIESRALKAISGQVITERLTEGLIREDGLCFFAIRDGIPVLLVQEGIALGPNRLPPNETQEKQPHRAH